MFQHYWSEIGSLIIGTMVASSVESKVDPVSVRRLLVWKVELNLQIRSFKSSFF
jgi:hypothetical protein